MSAKIFIAIPVHNRLSLAWRCVATIADTLHDGGNSRHGDTLAVYDDGSQEKAAWTYYADEVHHRNEPLGIEGQRRQHFVDFQHAIDRGRDFTHLYLTDSDALHDPNWRSELLRLQDKCGGAPICGYNTEAHARLKGNTIEDRPDSEVIWRRAAPGISYLLTRDHVAKVMRSLPTLPAHWHWDWTVPALLGHRFAVTRRSLVEHVGWQGLHHPSAEGPEGGDRATNPTEWLIQKRAEVVAALSQPA